jgi:hypothetical protein
MFFRGERVPRSAAAVEPRSNRAAAGHALTDKLFILLLALCAVLAARPAMAIEEPQYEVVRAYDGFEVRRYAPTIVAQTAVQAGLEDAGNEAFRILAGYIFGKNKGERKIAMTAPVAQTPAKIAMTAPVAQTAAGDAMIVQFTMPREWTLDTLPEPVDTRVELKAVPSRTVAVIRYSGTWSEARYVEHLDKLKAALARENLRWTGEPVWARYNPPMMPWFLRRNEIWLEVSG